MPSPKQDSPSPGTSIEQSSEDDNPLEQKIKTVREAYDQRREEVVELLDERHAKWDLTTQQLQQEISKIETEMHQTKLNTCIDNLQEILDRVGSETENITEESYCLAFYDKAGKLWQIKECRQADEEDSHLFDTDSAAFDTKKIEVTSNQMPHRMISGRDSNDAKSKDDNI